MKGVTCSCDDPVPSTACNRFEPFKADINAWCQAAGQGLIRTESTADGLRFLIEKRPTQPKDTKLAMVISNDGVEELLSPLGFALAAALEGIDVHLYFPNRPAKPQPTVTPSQVENQGDRGRD
jgi:hypothetical protein